MAIDAGASAVGLVSAMPSGPGPIPEDLIAKLRRRFRRESARFCSRACRMRLRSSISSGDSESTRFRSAIDCTHGSYQDLREALPGISLVQVVHVTGPEAVDEAIAVAPHVDAILLDSGNQSLEIKELGGTGRTHDWTLSRKIREAIEVPLFLAGGLNPSNVAAAIREVQPFGIDVCSGLRTNGALDPQKLTAFFTQINADWNAVRR